MILIALVYFIGIFILIDLTVQIVRHVLDAKERLVLKVHLSKQVRAPTRHEMPENRS